jgi:hypothetical protein
MTQLVKRYGPNGAFWKANPRLPQVPIRIWQIWNEPNLKLFWNIKPYAPPYVALPKASYAAIKKADQGAKVMMGGLPNRSWDALSAIYKAGAKPYFDIAAVHPYTYSPSDVMHIVSINRRVMNRNGDQRKAISLTETGWCRQVRDRRPDHLEHPRRSAGDEPDAPVHRAGAPAQEPQRAVRLLVQLVRPAGSLRPRVGGLLRSALLVGAPRWSSATRS